MQTAVEIVEGLTSVQAVSLLKRLNQILFGAVPYADVQAHLPADIDDLKLLENLDPEVKRQNLDAKTSVALARHLLMAFARDENLAPVVVHSWDEIKEDDSLFIETIVALGLIANLALFLATTEIQFKVGKLKVRKCTASAGMVKELMRPLTGLTSKMKLSG